MRLIDANAMCVDLATVNPKYKTMIDWANRVIKAQPTVDAEPVRHGHWIEVKWIDVNGDGLFWRCSVCEKIHCCKGNYCCECGAKMDGGDL